MSTKAITSEKVRDRPADLSRRVVVLFLDFLCNLYSNLEEFRFDEDERNTKIIIADKFADVLDSLGKKSALITDLKSIVKQEVGLDDRGMAHPQRMQGKQYRTALYNSSMLIYCISANQWESRRLAFLTGMGITGFEPEIRKQGQLTDVNVPVPVGEPVKLVTAAKARVWSTPVTVQVSFEETWLRSIIQDEILTKFQLGFTVNGNDLTS